jgi:hypothetical protein
MRSATDVQRHKDDNEHGERAKAQECAEKRVLASNSPGAKHRVRSAPVARRACATPWRPCRRCAGCGASVCRCSMSRRSLRSTLRPAVRGVAPPNRSRAGRTRRALAAFTHSGSSAVISPTSRSCSSSARAASTSRAGLTGSWYCSAACALIRTVCGVGGRFSLVTRHTVARQPARTSRAELLVAKSQQFCAHVVAALLPISPHVACTGRTRGG